MGNDNRDTCPLCGDELKVKSLSGHLPNCDEGGDDA